MINIKEYIESTQGRDEKDLPKAKIDFISSQVNIRTNESTGVPIECKGASVKLRDLGGYIMLDLDFNTAESVDMRMIYNYLEKYANDLNKITEESFQYPEIAFFINSKENEDYYILLANPVFWSWNTTSRVGEYNSIRLVFEEENYGFFKQEEDL